VGVLRSLAGGWSWWMGGLAAPVTMVDDGGVSERGGEMGAI
jgi:hypothetical protein